jgi:hypothetical protein
MMQIAMIMGFFAVRIGNGRWPLAAFKTANRVSLNSKAKIIMDEKLREIRIGDQVFIDDNTEDVGAVRGVAPGGREEVVIYIENGGEFFVPVAAIDSVHDGKVVLASQHLDRPILDAVAHAHDREVPGL